MAFKGSLAFDAGDQPGLLHRDDYPLPGVVDGRLLSLGRRGRKEIAPTLVIPCAEVLRACYAPHADLARAVLDHGWSRSMAKMLDLNRTGATADGLAWQLTTIARLRPEHLAIVANLAINPIACRRANLIRSEIATAHRPVIAALFPFDWEQLELTAACIRLRSADGEQRWFGYAIESLRWPPPPGGPARKITWIPAVDRRPGRERERTTARAFPSSAGRTRSLMREGRVTQELAPGSSKPVRVTHRGVDWQDAPSLERSNKTLSVVRMGARPLVSRRPVASGELLSAEGGSGSGVSSSVDPQTVGPEEVSSLPSLQFEQTLEMIETLRAEHSIQENVCEAPTVSELVCRGKIEAWAFPEVRTFKKQPSDYERRWYLRDFAKIGRSGEYIPAVRRAAMIQRLTIDDKFVWWLEVEARAYRQDRTRSLIFTLTGSMATASVIRMLLRIAVERAGVWPSSGQLLRSVGNASKQGILACAGWEHVRLTPDRTAKTWLRPLYAKGAIKEIRKVVVR